MKECFCSFSTSLETTLLRSSAILNILGKVVGQMAQPGELGQPHGQMLPSALSLGFDKAMRLIIKCFVYKMYHVYILAPRCHLSPFKVGVFF